MHVDILHLVNTTAAHGQGLFHGGISAIAFRGGSGRVECFIAVAVSAQFRQYLAAIPLYKALAFEHQVSSAFAQVQTVTIMVKRAAGLFVNIFQGVEPVDGKAGESLCTAADHAMGQALFDKAGAVHECIGRGGTGSTDCSDVARNTDPVCNTLGTIRTIQGIDVAEEVAFLCRIYNIKVDFFRIAHTSYGRGVDEANGLFLYILYASLLQGFLYGYEAQ